MVHFNVKAAEKAMSHEKYVKKVKDFVEEVIVKLLRLKRSHFIARMIIFTIGER